MILGLDLATSTGFAYGDGSSRPVVGSLRMPSTGHDVGEFCSFFRAWYVELLVRLSVVTLEDRRPLIVCLEAPILPEKKWNPVLRKMEGGTNIATTRKLQGLAAIVEMEAFDANERHKRTGQGREVQCFEAHLQTVKKELSGSGRADKGAMVLAARRAGIELSPGDEGQDEADAFGVWLLAVRYHAKEYSRLWDSVIHGGRNTLV